MTLNHPNPEVLLESASRWLEQGGDSIAPCRLLRGRDGRKWVLFGYPRDRTEADESMLTIKPQGRSPQKTNAVLGLGRHEVTLDLDGCLSKAEEMMADGKIPYPNAIVSNGGEGKAHFKYLPCEDMLPVGDRKFSDGTGAQVIYGNTGVFLEGSLHPITMRQYERREVGEDSVWHNKHSIAFFGAGALAPPKSKWNGHGGASTPDLDVVLGALEAINPDDYTAWINAGINLKGAFGDAALEVWAHMGQRQREVRPRRERGEVEHLQAAHQSHRPIGSPCQAVRIRPKGG